MKIALFLLFTSNPPEYINQFDTVADCATHGAMVQTFTGIGFSCMEAEAGIEPAFTALQAATTVAALRPR